MEAAAAAGLKVGLPSQAQHRGGRAVPWGATGSTLDWGGVVYVSREEWGRGEFPDGYLRLGITDPRLPEQGRVSLGHLTLHPCSGAQDPLSPPSGALP